MKKAIMLACALAMLAAPATLAAPGTSPAKFCKEVLPVVDPGASEFLGTGGGCVSSVASVGAEALMDGAFPSTAAAIANWKFLEVNAFAPTNGGDPYPYAFYGNPNYVAKNRADCVTFLRAFHTGQLEPGPGN
jgi:hypothetical protein